MKNLLLAPLSLLLLVFFTFIPVRAQIETESSVEITTAENDYRHQFDLYRDAYHTYTLTKAQWLSTRNLKNEQEAIQAAKNAALTRTDVMMAYTRWLRLRLLQFASTYEKTTNLASQLEKLNDWYLAHKTNVQTANTVSAFDQIMIEYSNPSARLNRETLYSLTQTELKIAQLAYFQHQSRAIYEPVLKILQTKTDIPEIEQGLTRIDQLGKQINDELDSISAFGGTLEAESFNSAQYFRKINPRLNAVHSNQITLLNLMIELESRYVRN